MTAPVALGTERLTLALFSLGELRFGVASEWLLHALAWPQAMTVLPRREGALVGLFAHRGQMVPVLDMRRWLPWPGGESARPAQVMLLRSGEQVLGLAIDAVQGLRRVLPQQLQRLHHGDAGDELFHSAALLSDEDTGAAQATDRAPTQASQTVAVLDVPALMRLAQVWSPSCEAPQAGLASAASLHLASPGQVASQALHAVLIAGERWLAVRASALCAVLPMPTLQQVFGRHPRLLGVARWRGNDLAVLGTEDRGVAVPALMAVLVHGGRHVAIAVDRAHAMMPLDLNGAQLMPGGENLHRIDCEALVAQYAMPVALGDAAAGGLSGAGAPRTLAAVERPAEAHVVVQAGQAWALGISAIDGIRELPDGVLPAPQGQPAFLGNTRWKQAVVPLFDLRVLSGHSGLSAAMPVHGLRVIYLRHRERVLGFVVEQLMMLLPAHAGSMGSLLQRGGGQGRLITMAEVRGSGVPVRSFGLLPEALLVEAAAMAA